MDIDVSLGFVCIGFIKYTKRLAFCGRKQVLWCQLGLNRSVKSSG